MNATATLYHVDEVGLSAEDGGRWVLICDTHGHIIQDTNRRRLSQWKNHVIEWCEAHMEEE